MTAALPTHRRDSTAARKAATSHAPRARSNASIILQAIRNYPGLTSKQLAEVTGIGREETARRTADLKRRGLVLDPKELKLENADGEYLWYESQPKPEKPETAIRWGEQLKL